MNLFVLGGTGFISGALVRRLLADGHRVTTFTRGRSAPAARHERLTETHGDRRRRADLERAAADGPYDAVFDMIAYVPDESALAADVFAGRAARFIHCSTISVYMVSDAVRCPIGEDQDRLPARDAWPRSPFGHQYGLDKRRCEEVLWARHDAEAFPVTMLRPTYVSGPEDRTLRDVFWIERVLDGRPLLVPGCGDHAYQPIYVDDLAHLFADVLRRPETVGQAYNAVGEDILTLNTYLDLLGRLTGRDAERVHVPRDVFDRLDLSTHPRGDVFPFDTQRTAVFSLDRTKRDLDVRTTPPEEWLQTTIDWFRRDYDGHSLGYDRRDEEVAFARRWKARHEALVREVLADTP